MVYTYDSNNKNLLKKVLDQSNHPQGFKDDSNGIEDSEDDYDYDDFGNLIRDQNKQITHIVYNHLHLPVQILFANGNIITYFYNATGQKVRKAVKEGITTTQTDYMGGFQYKNTVLQFFAHAEGYCKPNGVQFDYVYSYKDHLGNVRLSFEDKDKNGVLGNEEIVSCGPPDRRGFANCVSFFTTAIVDENHYYPFGLQHEGYDYLNEAVYKYKYNGKELQDELGLNMYDYGWRNYMPDVGRWTQIDPLFNELTFAHDNDDYDPDDDEEAYLAIINDLELGGGIYNTDNLNPYGYGYNNPVSFDDPDGRCPTCIIGFIVGAATDYGIQVASNYLDPTVKNKWTDNISVSSIMLSGGEGFVTQGSSAVRKIAVKGTATLINNTIDVNTTKGVKVDTNAKNVLKNTAIDLVADKGAGTVSSVAKTKQLDKVANKVDLKSNTKSKNFVQKTTGLSSKTSSAVAKKTDVKGVSKQASNGVKNLPNKAVENGTKAGTKKYIDDAKDKTKIK